MEALKTVTTDPNNVASFTAKLDIIRREAQKLVPHKTISLKDVEQYRASQPKIQISRQKRQRFPRVPIYASKPNECWGCDTGFLPDLSSMNNGEGCILVFIDVFTRMMHVRTCKKPTAAGVVGALQSIFQETGLKPGTLFSDLGKFCCTYAIISTVVLTLGGEFRNAQVAAFLHELNIKQIYSRDPSVKCSIAERAIRTLKGRIYKWIAASGRFNFTSVLQQLVKAYNHQWHRSLPQKLSPVEAAQNEDLVYEHLYGKRWKKNKHLRFTFDLHDHVRIAKKSTTFSKAHKLSNWSAEVYEISVSVLCLIVFRLLYTLLWLFRFVYHHAHHDIKSATLQQESPFWVPSTKKSCRRLHLTHHLRHYTK